MSDQTGIIRGMVSFDIASLIDQFDTRADTADTAFTGSLSSLLGEVVLLETLRHSLEVEGYTVRMLPDRPTRDDIAFGIKIPRPRARDLDAWLLLDEMQNNSQLVAVECKHRTAASIDGSTVPDDPEQLAAYARERWITLKADHIDTGEWTDHSKVYLPLQPPPSLGTATATRAMLKLRRVLAI
jgi:hypothetical protein